MATRRSHAVALAGVLVVAFGLQAARAAQTTTADELIATGAVYAGQDAVAIRIIEATALRPGEVGRFQFGVRRFLSESDVEVALDQSLDYALTDPRFAGLQQSDAPMAGDAAAAVAGAVTLDGVDVVIAILFVQDGQLLHSWTAVALDGDLLPILSGIADGHFADPAILESIATPGAPPSRDDPATLLDLLPTLDDPPAGYVLDSEAAAAVTPPDAATPAA